MGDQLAGLGRAWVDHHALLPRGYRGVGQRQAQAQPVPVFGLVEQVAVVPDLLFGCLGRQRRLLIRRGGSVSSWLRGLCGFEQGQCLARWSDVVARDRYQDSLMGDRGHDGSAVVRSHRAFLGLHRKGFSRSSEKRKWHKVPTPPLPRQATPVTFSDTKRNLYHHYVNGGTPRRQARLGSEKPPVICNFMRRGMAAAALFVVLGATACNEASASGLAIPDQV